MARRLIVDSGVLIAFERARRSVAELSATDDDLAVAAISPAELSLGALLGAPERRRGREKFITDVLELVPVAVYDADIAAVHADLTAYARRAGEPRGTHDLMVAATAVVLGRTILSTDSNARFGDLPGVDVLVVPAS